MGDLRATAEELRKIIEQFIDAGEVKTAKGFLERWLSVAVAARLQENGIQCSLDDALHTAGLEEDETILAFLTTPTETQDSLRRFLAYMDQLFQAKTPSGEHRQEYQLKLYDDVLLTFWLYVGPFGDVRCVLGHVSSEARPRLPLDLELSGEGVMNWLRKRVIPKNRAFVNEILGTFGLNRNNVKGIIDVCKGLSLNDSYWVVPTGSAGKFSQYNLYENRFSEALALVAYTGVGSTDAAFTTSPELTTNGMLPKAWRFLSDDGVYLYKGGTEGAANAGNEPYAEYYACQVAEAMGLSAVHYDLEYWKGILASKCKLFTDIDTAFVPIGRIVKNAGLQACIDYYKAQGEAFYQQLCSMFVFDAVIYNEDRHFGNFGLLRDNHTGKLIAPAPIFDNGLSLFAHSMPSDWQDMPTYAATRSNPYEISYDALCRKVMGAEQRKQLRRLIGFRFTRHPTINWPEERLLATEQQLARRVEALLGMTG